MNKPLVLAAAVGLLAGAVAALVLVFAPQLDMAPGTAPQATGKALIGGPFSLLDQTGKRVTEKDFAGRPMLVYFGFTNCPDVCPAGLQVIAAALDKLGPKAGGLTPLFITLDPERDTPQVIGEYVKSFNPRIVGLSGSPEDIAAVAKAYRVYFKKIADEKSPGKYSVDHSAYMYLMSPTGEFLKHFPHTVSVDQLADELAKAL
jgi:protein SCO1/2